jgi:uncharacterized protein (DUF433 family)
MAHGTRSDMARGYVEWRDSAYWIQDTRISLDSIVYAFRRGMAPESIQRAFPLLTLEEVYGAIAYYLANAEEIDAHLGQSERELAAQAKMLNDTARASNRQLFRRLEKARRQRKSS